MPGYIWCIGMPGLAKSNGWLVRGPGEQHPNKCMISTASGNASYQTHRQGTELFIRTVVRSRPRWLGERENVWGCPERTRAFSRVRRVQLSREPAGSTRSSTADCGLAQTNAGHRHVERNGNRHQHGSSMKLSQVFGLSSSAQTATGAFSFNPARKIHPPKKEGTQKLSVKMIQSYFEISKSQGGPCSQGMVAWISSQQRESRPILSSDKAGCHKPVDPNLCCFSSQARVYGSMSSGQHLHVQPHLKHCLKRSRMQTVIRRPLSQSSVFLSGFCRLLREGPSWSEPRGSWRTAVRMIMTVERTENAAVVEQPGQAGAQGHASPGQGVQQPRQLHREVAPAHQEHQPQTSAHAQPRLQTNEMILQQLREITGVDDVRALDHAYQAGKGDLAEVVSILTNQNVSLVTNRNGEVVQVRNAQRPPGQAGRPDGRANTQEPAGVIDLTADTEDKDQDDLQRAIALSLQEAQTANTDNRPQGECRPKRRKSSVSWDNVQETPREAGWPVGLKNVGNTCWFSAVIQSLFHLPVFRDLVLGFQFFPKDWPANSRESLVLHFMQELRCLFARMQGSNRKYIDPTCVVKSLRELIPIRAGETQQDVSEFTHKLLDLLEEAFIIVQRRQGAQPGSSAGASSSESGGDKKSNPMLDLFYGRIQAEGMHAGKMFTNQQTVGQYTLQVNGFKDLHESLEGATAQGEIETGHEEGSTKSGQEVDSRKAFSCVLSFIYTNIAVCTGAHHVKPFSAPDILHVLLDPCQHWFTHLPPVLTFELSRFEFNQKLGKAEKIHHKLEFPKFLYMDRYLVKNKEVTRQKREHMKSMKEEMDSLQAKLDSFLNYGSGYKRLPLPDILKYTLEFAEKSTVEVTQGQVQRSNGNGSSRVANGNGLNGSSEKKDEEDGSSDDFEVISAIHSADTLACLSKKTLDAVATKKAAPVPSSGDTAIPSKVHIPCPHHVTKELYVKKTSHYFPLQELAVLQTCLRRWRHEVEKEVKGG
uniref:ubiquitinyl hydrolase 1 n=1 Tax=Branchiostoma floridae TaxID=7739 RepID=C3Y0N6_BRAFL|eukprot:XP_002610299.1 hypothetical protein BRAFLDRAFT_126861 [Branchiostoma floridae]